MQAQHVFEEIGNFIGSLAENIFECGRDLVKVMATLVQQLTRLGSGELVDVLQYSRDLLNAANTLQYSAFRPIHEPRDVVQQTISQQMLEFREEPIGNMHQSSAV